MENQENLDEKRKECIKKISSILEEYGFDLIVANCQFGLIDKEKPV